MPSRTIVRLMEDLPSLEFLRAQKRLGIDIESTSFDDNTEAFHPFSGHRIVGIGLMTEARDAWYIPLRHAPIDMGWNLPFEEIIPWLKELFSQEHVWIAHNIKFDMCFLAQDGLFLKGELEDTVVLTRLHNPIAFSAGLDAACRQYLPERSWKHQDAVLAELKARRSKDFGVVPPDIMGHYCLQDIEACMSLREHLLSVLDPRCYSFWETEKKVVRVLFNSEMRGVYVPRKDLQKYTLDLLKKIVPKKDRVDELAGEFVDVLSNQALTKVLSSMAIKPIAFSPDTGEPSWTSEVLRSYDMEFTNLLADLKEHYSKLANYAEGWVRRLDSNDVLHPSFKQFGTKTGRFSCVDPNFMNLDKTGKSLVKPRPGYCFLSIDYSQIEFRLFAHYTASKNILGKYQNDPWTDFHQATADLLGIDRSSAKTINFGMIYGMGKEKLQRSLTAAISQAIHRQSQRAQGLSDEVLDKTKAADEFLLEALKKFNYGAPVTLHNAHQVSGIIYSVYHRRMPEIRLFGKRVSIKAHKDKEARGTFGRVYRKPEAMEIDNFAFKLKNWIVQGGAADLLKDRLAGIEDVLTPHEAYLLCNVHDQVLIEVPLGREHACAAGLVKHLESPSVELRVPIKVDVQVCYTSWADEQDLKAA